MEPTELNSIMYKKTDSKKSDLEKNNISSLPLGKAISGMKIRLLNDGKYAKKVVK